MLHGDERHLENAHRERLSGADFKLAGGPAWLNANHFDLVAKAPVNLADALAAPAPGTGGGPSVRQLMLQALLADRFKLVVHTENPPSCPCMLSSAARSDKKPVGRLK